MLGDAVIHMPTDLRPSATFELDSPVQFKPKGITRMTVGIPSSYNSRPPAESHPTARWRTTEFMCYYVVFALALPLMAWIPYTLSTREYLFEWQHRASWLYCA